MKRIFLLAALALLMPAVASATTGSSETPDWRVWGYKTPNARHRDVVLVIAGVPVAASQLGANTTLKGRLEGRDVTLRCQRRPAYSSHVSCNVYADDQLLKTFDFQAPR
ncbi:MAG: hypothetical protein ACE5HM_05765 [Acidiferrobacterales bacterium]